MSHLRVRYCAVLTLVFGSFLLLRALEAQSQQSANSPPTSNGQGAPTNAPPALGTEPFSVVTSNGTWTNQAGTSTPPVTPLPFNAFDVVGWFDPFGSPQWFGFPNPFPSLSPWGVSTGVLSYVYDPPSLACDFPGCPRIVNPAGDVIDPGTEGAPTLCLGCAPYQEPGSGAILLNVPTSTDYPEPVDSSVLNPSDGIVIHSQLVPDSPAPANGITIETQFVANPSNDAIEANLPSVPISIESSLVPSGEGASGGPQYVSGSVSSGRHWGFSDLMPWLEFGGPVITAIDNIQNQGGTRQSASNKQKSVDPCAIADPHTIVYATGCTDSKGHPLPLWSDKKK